MMNTIYIDYTHSTPLKGVKAHGGANYTKTVILDFIEYLQENNIDREVVLLWPTKYEPTSIIENSIYHNRRITIKCVSESIENIDYEENATIYLPLLGVKEFGLIKKLKEKGLKVALTVHGLRLLDKRFDSYDKLYEFGIKSRICGILGDLTLGLRKSIYKRELGDNLSYADLVFTVSNFSMAGLAKYAKISRLVLQYENTLPSVHADLKTIEQYKRIPFMLFVSGNRTEKNLARTLDAYKRYFENAQEPKLFFIVGTDKKVQESLIKGLQIEKFIHDNKIVFFDYITDEELAGLYECASFLVYTSKSEGFGLPALEAAKHNCPTVAAYGTSIPEVLGEGCIYVNPYSVESICDGMLKMSDDMVMQRYKVRLEELLAMISIRTEISKANVAEALLEL